GSGFTKSRLAPSFSVVLSIYKPHLRPSHTRTVSISQSSSIVIGALRPSGKGARTSARTLNGVVPPGIRNFESKLGGAAFVLYDIDEHWCASEAFSQSVKLNRAKEGRDLGLEPAESRSGRQGDHD